MRRIVERRRRGWMRGRILSGVDAPTRACLHAEMWMDGMGGVEGRGAVQLLWLLLVIEDDGRALVFLFGGARCILRLSGREWKGCQTGRQAKHERGGVFSCFFFCSFYHTSFPSNSVLLSSASYFAVAFFARSAAGSYYGN